MEHTCKDCRFYLPIDVIRGLCKADKSSISPDQIVCDQFDRMAKCKFCQHFSQGKEYLGKCKENSLTSPDMNAVKCVEFTWQQLN